MNNSKHKLRTRLLMKNLRDMKMISLYGVSLAALDKKNLLIIVICQKKLIDSFEFETNPCECCVHIIDRYCRHITNKNFMYYTVINIIILPVQFICCMGM